METEKTYGPIIGLVIIIVVIALGSVYFLQKREQNVAPQDQNAEQQTEQIVSQNDSDEITDIEADLNATNFSEIDAGISDLDTSI